MDMDMGMVTAMVTVTKNMEAEVEADQDQGQGQDQDQEADRKSHTIKTMEEVAKRISLETKLIISLPDMTKMEQTA